MSNLRELVEHINSTRTQASASAKDEIKVMRAMLNDPSFKVDVYSANGIVGQYCPYTESRAMVASIIKQTTKISPNEARALADSYEFGNQESSAMVGIAKEFINQYIDTGRKLPLGGRANSNISLSKKVKEERSNKFPRKVGVDDKGNPIYKTFGEGTIPQHDSIKVHSSCPPWLRQQNNIL